MIDLPAGLAPWAAQLAQLPADLALALAPWVGRLALAIGPISETYRHRTGEPDGYSGLSRRGSYERLVAAEWGIAEHFPDEFLRRATAGEHLFLEVARKEPQGARRSIAIVSAGPAQLGSPRLAHLAALVVFARRAADAGAAFQWGVLEDRKHRLFAVDDETAVQRWLQARTALVADRDAVTAWLRTLGAARGDDVWLIGGPEHAADARSAHARTLVVRDVLDPHVRALDVDVERGGARSRVRLALPSSDDCARLLRDPYHRGTAATRIATPGQATDVRFAAGGRRVFVHLDHGAIESWPIPSSPREPVGKPQRWSVPRDHALVAVGNAGRRSILAATATRDDPTALELSYSSSSHRVRVTLPAYVGRLLAADSSPPVGACGLVQLRQHAATDLVLQVGGQLLVVLDFTLWPPAGTVLNAVVLSSAGPSATPPQAIATTLHKSSVVWAEQAGEGRLRVVEGTSSGNRTVATLDGALEGPVHFGFALPAQSSSWGIVAVPREGDEWIVAAADLPPTRLRASAPVVGVSLQRGTPALLTRSHPDRLTWLVGDQRKLLPTALAPFVAVAVSTAQPHVAWVTETGEIVLYSMEHDGVLMRRVPGAAE